MEVKREQWKSRLGFILATVGSAVGLGNIWRFPTVVAQGGGGAFVLLFLVIAVLIGVPAIIAELTLGRKSQKNIVSTFSKLVPGTKWRGAGFIALIAVLMILSFYSVIAGWAAIYFFGSIFGIFSGLDPQSLTGLHKEIVSHPFIPVLGQGMFLSITIIIVLIGITGGIERWSKALMPGIIIILFILLARTLLLDGALEGVKWFLTPDFTRMSVNTALSAVGQVFFSFSLGMGAIVTYGSYLSPKENIPGSAFLISFADIGIAILMGLIIIPALFAFDLQPEIGAGIIFVTLPSIFNTMPAGAVWSSLFFLMLSFAALTSSVSLLEVGVSYFIDEKKWPRAAAASILGVFVFLLGLPSILSQGIWSNIMIAGKDILDFMDFTASSILLPLGGLLTSIFLGWVWGTDNAIDELHKGARWFFWEKQWAFLMRYIIPAAILYILVSGI